MDQQQHLQALFYSGQPENVEIALLQAPHYLPQLQAIAQNLLLFYEEHFSNNQLQDAEKIADLVARNSLSINYIHHLPLGLWFLPKMEKLHIQHYTMSALPAEIGLWAQLKELSFNFGFNCRRLPDELGNLQGLQRLDLDNNAIEELPASIGQLENLQILSLRANCLHGLPDELGQLQQLKKFNLAQNPLQRQLVPNHLFNKNKTSRAIVATLRRVFKV